MPSTVTHECFSMDVYDKFSPLLKQRFANYTEYLKIFSNGHDVMFFYNLANILPGKRIRKLGSRAHHENVQKFFFNLVSEIKIQKLEKNYEIMSFLYGYLCHFALDSTIHPFVDYRCGIVSRDNKKTFKYQGEHDEMEAYIDSYFIYTRFKVIPKHFKVYDYAFKVTKFSKKLENIISETFYKTYEIKNVGIYYTRAVRQMKNFFRFYRNDRTGLKKILYTCLDFVRPKRFKRMKSISYNIDHKVNDYYLNFNKEEWGSTLNEFERYNASFIELYRKSIDLAVTYINEINKIIYDNENINNIFKILPDITFSHGVLEEKEKELRFFEF